MSETLFIGILSAQTVLILALVGLLNTRQSAHERQCQEWQRQLMKEHGALTARVDDLRENRA